METPSAFPIEFPNFNLNTIFQKFLVDALNEEQKG